MQRYPKLIVVFMIALGLLQTPGSTAGAPVSGNVANRAIESIGWILTFNLGQDLAANLRADFHFLLKFQNSSADYDLSGTVSIDCGPHQQAGNPQQCAIPDMATLILEASSGRIDIRQMQIPSGTLEACGQITRTPVTKSTARDQNVDILRASSSKLYALSIADQALVLTHAKRGIAIQLPDGSSRFHLSLPDTTLTAPATYTLTILTNAPGVYTLDRLTIVDPGAFAHLQEQACST